MKLKPAGMNKRVMPYGMMSEMRLTQLEQKWAHYSNTPLPHHSGFFFERICK
jgi:hypothetical protein